MKKFAVSVEGISPILHARHPTPTEEEQILHRSKGAGKKMKNITDEEQYEMHAYKNAKKKFIQPAEMFEAAMVKAAVAFRMEGKKTYKDAIKAGIFIEPVEIIHDNQDFELDGRWGKNPNTRGAVWVVRPRCDDWKVSFEINLLLDERISDETIKEILDYAGLYVGVGAWRPKFGRFHVTAFDEITESTKVTKAKVAKK